MKMTSTEVRAAQIAAVKELVTHDHAFLAPEDVRRLTRPFGFKGRTSWECANPTEFKGLTLWDGRVAAEGQCATEVAREICHKLGVDYQFGGRGSTLRSCCKNLLAYLEG
jgi:hypothetical protein